MSYERLEIEDVSIDDLQLDLENYRIPTAQTSEQNALKYMFAYEDVLGSALEILRDGYFDNEVPIVMKEGGKYIVLEGNRRVSALKALANPDLIPGHKNEIERLLKKYETESRDLPNTIRVMVSPDRETVAPRIARLHTGLPKKSWSLDQQANFYYSLLDEYTTVDHIKADFRGVSIPRLIRWLPCDGF